MANSTERFGVASHPTPGDSHPLALEIQEVIGLIAQSISILLP